MPFVYQNVFGGSNIYPSEVSYRPISLAANQTLVWPLESAPNADNYIAKIMDVAPQMAGLVITLPDARDAGLGVTVLFGNTAAPNSYLVRASGTTTGQIAQVSSGQWVQLYLADNTTQAGVWRAVPYGVGTSTAQTASLAGYGLIADGNTLDTAVPSVAISADTILNARNRASLINWTGTSGTLFLPSPADVGANWFVLIRNTGTATAYGTLTIDAPGNVKIDNASNKSLKPTESCYVICDGSNFYSVGYGQNAQFAFDYVVVPLPVSSGDYALTGDYLNRISYGFTGLLTGDVYIVVPDAKQQYWIYNGTTGPYNLYVKTAGQTTGVVQIIQGQRLIVYCDGNNVYRANDNNIPIPIPISQGGTGATTSIGALGNFGLAPFAINLVQADDQNAALTALGATAVGRGVFLAVSTDTGQTALGGATTGKALFVSASPADARNVLQLQQGTDLLPLIVAFGG